MHEESKSSHRKTRVLLLFISVLVLGAFFFWFRTAPTAPSHSSGIVRVSDLSLAAQQMLAEQDYKDWIYRLPTSDAVDINMSAEKLSQYRARFDRMVGHKGIDGFRMDPRRIPPRRRPYPKEAPSMPAASP